MSGKQSIFNSDFDTLKTVLPKVMALRLKSQYSSGHLIKFDIFLNLLKT